MSFYFAAYVVVWAALFGYLWGISSRQARLNERAAALVERLAREEPTPPRDRPEPDEG